MGTRILGQVYPPATTDVILYTCPSNTVVSTLFACAIGTGSVRIWIRRNGETTSSKQYLYYDESLTASETLSVTAGITLSSGDDIMVRSSSGTIAFSAFGAEG